jgi:hypothetical protein
VEELFQQQFVDQMGGTVQAQTTRREGGHDSLSFRLQHLFRQGVQVREVEVTIQAVQG